MTRTLAAQMDADRPAIPRSDPAAPMFRAGAAARAWGRRLARRSGRRDRNSAEPGSPAPFDSTLVGLVPAAGIGAVMEALRRHP
jgi:hypothetical protein